MDEDAGQSHSPPPPPPLSLDYQSPRDRTDPTTAQRVLALLLSWAGVMCGGFCVVSVVASTQSTWLAAASALAIIGCIVTWGLAVRRRGFASSVFVGLGLGLLCQGLCFYTLSVR